MARTQFFLSIPFTTIQAGQTKTIAALGAPANLQIAVLGFSVSFGSPTGPTSPTVTVGYFAAPAPPSGTTSPYSSLPCIVSPTANARTIGANNFTTEPTYTPLQTAYESVTWCSSYWDAIVVPPTAWLGIQVSVPQNDAPVIVGGHFRGEE